MQVTIAFFSGAVEKFSGKDGSVPPPEKIGSYAYVTIIYLDNKLRIRIKQLKFTNVGEI